MRAGAGLVLRRRHVVVGGALLALLLASFGLQTLKFSPGAIIGFRVGLLVVFAGLVALRTASDAAARERHAGGPLVEGREPRLQAAILSAVEVGATGRIAARKSPVMVDRLVEQAIEKYRAIEGGRASAVVTSGAPDRSPPFGRVAAAARGRAAVPSSGRVGAARAHDERRGGQPLRHQVTPGNATVPKGLDQMIAATLSGFRSTTSS